MPVTVIVGAQYGGEGKGKVTAHLARQHSNPLVIRCGGPNSGHTITVNGVNEVVRQVPASVVQPDAKLAIAAGAIIDPNVLLAEIKRYNLTPDRLTVDGSCVIVEPEHRAIEAAAGGLRARIGSTATGTGIAVSKRALREPGTRFARDLPDLKPFIGTVRDLANETYDQAGEVIVEGTQGYGLSLYHTDDYPHCTSRDTTASAFLSEVGLAPSTVQDVVMAVRTYPIRVAGPSGKLPGETSWEAISATCGAPEVLLENTTVTKTLRRVASFDLDLVLRAAKANRPTILAVHGTDYIDFANRKAGTFGSLSKRTMTWIANLEMATKSQVRLVGNGPLDTQLLDRQLEAIIDA